MQAFWIHWNIWTSAARPDVMHSNQNYECRVRIRPVNKKKIEFRLFVEIKIKIHIRIILGVRQAALHTRCDDEVSLHFNAFFCLSSWTHSMRCCTFNILRKKRTSMWRRCCVPQNWNQDVHTERIFIEFSIETSIIVALASHTREPKAMSNSCKFNFFLNKSLLD